MVIYNTCVKCGRKVQIRTPRLWYIAKALADSTTVVCKECDWRSAWKPIKQK